MNTPDILMVSILIDVHCAGCIEIFGWHHERRVCRVNDLIFEILVQMPQQVSLRQGMEYSPGSSRRRIALSAVPPFAVSAENRIRVGDEGIEVVRVRTEADLQLAVLPESPQLAGHDCTGTVG